ncbi:hypothetical protein FRC14_007124 [Serendipita sp. 396]|nr:hypothetical protein FRC14_007124 [Serendipita sp. 396]KAG8777872.1 hypothetical protein FRC15_011067 [Serendipita sp. 397]KAG8783021.1 hypothetical protein FRC16_002503 [Serendipita sp. 398]KAG8819190.1 hypothetical protein FRC18_012168 [Serendipita sp. 400]KAG8848477.1 hypothetical protein FRC20_002541 [Serendipita sp. 405]
MTLSHETEPAGTAAMYNGTVPLLANAGIHLVTVAQCLDTDAYEYVGNYGTRDSTWYCGGTWTPSNPTSTSTTISSTSSTSSTTSSTPAPTCVSTYSSQPNDTCASIEANFGLPAGSILAANSFLNCNDIWQYTPICIPPGGTGSTTRPTSTSTSTSTTRTTSTSSTTSSTPVPTCVTTYVSRPNDTCATVESQFHLSTGAISAANSFVNCNDIWSGTPLCIPPGGIGASCTSTISSSPGDTCDRIGSRYGISGYQVQLWNSFLNCNDIWTYTPVCVSHS